MESLDLYESTSRVRGKDFLAPTLLDKEDLVSQHLGFVLFIEVFIPAVAISTIARNPGYSSLQSGAMTHNGGVKRRDMAESVTEGIDVRLPCIP